MALPISYCALAQPCWADLNSVNYLYPLSLGEMNEAVINPSLNTNYLNESADKNNPVYHYYKQFTNADELKAAYDKLDAASQAYFEPTVKEMEAEAKNLGLGKNGAYALAWIKLWVGSYNAQTDDGPICNTLVNKSAVDQFGLLVYSKVRSVEESDEFLRNSDIKVRLYRAGDEDVERLHDLISRSNQLNYTKKRIFKF